MLGENLYQSRIFLNIKGGNVVRRTEQGEELQYSFIEGRIENIYRKQRNFRGETVEYWYINMTDETGREYYSLGFPYSSNVFKSIIMSLSSDENLSHKKIIKILPYHKGIYDKVVVYSNGVKLDWIKEPLPPVRSVQIGGKEVKDDSQRMEFIKGKVNILNDRLR